VDRRAVDAILNEGGSVMAGSRMEGNDHMERARHCADRVGAQRSDSLRKRMINLCLSYLRKAVNRGRV